jgi:hypothetical protein
MPLIENSNSVLGNSYRQLAVQLAGPALQAPVPHNGGALSHLFSTQGKR